MVKRPRLVALSVIASLAVLSTDALATKVPIAFSPTLGADPIGTQQKLTQLEGKLPASFALPATMTTLTSGQVKLQFFPETAKALQRAQTAGTTPMGWPATTMCPKHAAFTAPATLLAPGASAACVSAETALRQKLANAKTACTDVAEPEGYVRAYAPAQVNETTTGSIESLIGLAGEALSHYPIQAGVLPPEWVPTLRNILWKIRRSPNDARIAAARASYAEVTSTLTSQAACFDATARTALAASVSALDAELSAVKASTDKVDADGKIAADHEIVCLAAKSRTRNALPFPSLTADERRFVAFWLGGVYWRMRGGGLMPLGSTQQARHFFLENPFKRIGELAGGSEGNEAAFRIFLNIFDGWGEWMDMGTTPGGQDLYEDLVQMTDRGRQQVADTPVLPGYTAATKYLEDKKYDVTDLLTGGLEMGPCYAFGLDPLSSFRYAATTSAPYGAFIEGFTAVGEFCTGASIALGMSKSLLDGVPNGKPPADLCSSRKCGDDGCGGSCGTCPSGLTCNNGTCGTACVPSCAGKTCGDDGCGGSCGTCTTPSSDPPLGGPNDPTNGDDPSTRSASGCGCGVPGAPVTPAAPAAVVLLALVAALRVRATRSRSTSWRTRAS